MLGRTPRGGFSLAWWRRTSGLQGTEWQTFGSDHELAGNGAVLSGGQTEFGWELLVLNRNETRALRSTGSTHQVLFCPLRLFS